MQADALPERAHNPQYKLAKSCGRRRSAQRCENSESPSQGSARSCCFTIGRPNALILNRTLFRSIELAQCTDLSKEEGSEFIDLVVRLSRKMRLPLAPRDGKKHQSRRQNGQGQQCDHRDGQIGHAHHRRECAGFARGGDVERGGRSLAGSASRQRTITRSTRGSMSGTIVDGSVGRDDSARQRSHRGEDLVEDQAQRVDSCLPPVGFGVWILLGR